MKKCIIVCGVDKLERKRRDREAERKWDIERYRERDRKRWRDSEGEVEIEWGKYREAESCMISWPNFLPVNINYSILSENRDKNQVQ